MTQRCTWPIKRTLVSKNSKFTIQIYTYVIVCIYTNAGGRGQGE